MRKSTTAVGPALVLALVAVLWVGIGSLFEQGGPEATANDHGTEHASNTPGLGAKEHPLPMPSTKTLEEFQKLLFPWVLSREYDHKLAWSQDKAVRDTGPYIKGKYYGTHPAVRCWYSPKVMYWMTGDPAFWPEGVAAGKAPRRKPREGDIPDGGMIIKEMFAPPSARW
jgi:hypothetical protein